MLRRIGVARWMRVSLWLCLSLVLLCAGCKRRSSSESPAPSPEAKIHGLELKDDVFVGSAQRTHNVSLFALLSNKQEPYKPVTTLAAALAKQEAVVRELGSGDADEPGIQPVNYPRGGPSVGQLEVVNKGKLPIYVLAGTVVKGGNQDRQVAEDVVVAPMARAPIETFCVEHGRWSSTRFGSDTKGKFSVSSKQLATSKVRKAAQYEKNQGKVWHEVGQTNAAADKSPASGTLLATLDDAAFAKKRDALADRMNGHLKAVAPNQQLVGLAVAIDGEVKAVRWFASHELFELFREQLVASYAADALISPSADKKNPKQAKAEAVREFVLDTERSQQTEERPTAAENVNQHIEAKKSYASKTRFKRSSPAKGAPAGRPKKPLSSDYLAK